MMNHWPTEANVKDYYGDPDVNHDGASDAAWESANLIYVTPPWGMVAAWNTAAPIKRFRCHKLVAQSLMRVMVALHGVYKTQDALERVKLHLFGGCHQFRTKRGGASLSMHAYGAAIDIDPAGNPLGVRWRPGMMDSGIVQAFRAEGWEWGGDWTKRPDCQHFQAVRTS